MQADGRPLVLLGWGKCEGSLKYQWKMPLGIDVFLPVELIINNGCTFLIFQPFSVFILDIFLFLFFLDVIKIAYFCDKV